MNSLIGEQSFLERAISLTQKCYEILERLSNLDHLICQILEIPLDLIKDLFKQYINFSKQST